ncbi:hypothetical protein Btru_060393 [Bulinus truncatus]|nr:hypothetical protein Btru_060393 [Bulinus truncatus]
MSEAGPRVNGPASPTGKYIDGIDPDDPQYIKNLQRPAEVKEDLQQMENRSRVSLVLSSQAFKEELEQVVEEQLRSGPYPASLIALQQITDLLLPHSKGNLGSLARAATVIPINDLRGVESLGFAKGEKLLRCKLAALYRIIDLCGWSHSIYNHISARVSPDHEHFLLNPFGMLYSEITASSLIKVDVKGEIVEPGSTQFGVSKAGFTLHSAIHQARPDIKCIVHLHTPAAVAVSAMKCGLLPMSQEALICGKLSYHDYQGIFINPEEREKLARNLGVHNKILVLRNHGIVACGETIEEAFHFTFNVMAACEAQVKAVPAGLDNIVIPSEEAREQAFKTANQGGGGVESTGRKWKLGELEFEALMRTLDNSGYRTGYVYKIPFVKQEKKERSNSEVEIPPASSSFTYVFDGDIEHSKYASPIKAAMERQKKAYKAGWLTTPNAYKKTEVEEIGTITPKKITKWVPDGESPNRPGGTPIKIENPNQFAPQGDNPKEFKLKQKSIRKDYYEEKVTPGPQSKILEGISWDEAQKVKDGLLSGAGDQLIVVGAASKGIIQRDHQHNAVVYRQYYAANPFENMSEAEIEQYQAEVQRRERGEPVNEIVSESANVVITSQQPSHVEQAHQPESSNEVEPIPETRKEAEAVKSNKPIEELNRTSRSPPDPQQPRKDKALTQLADTVVQTVISDALSVLRRGKGQQILTGTEPLHQHSYSSQHSMGSQILNSQNTKKISSTYPDKNSNHTCFRDTMKQLHSLGQCRGENVGGKYKKFSLDTREDAVGAATEDLRWCASGASNPDDYLTINLDPIQLYHGQTSEGTMKVKFTIHSTVRRHARADTGRGSIIDGICASVSEPHVEVAASSSHNETSDMQNDYSNEAMAMNTNRGEKNRSTAEIGFTMSKIDLKTHYKGEEKSTSESSPFSELPHNLALITSHASGLKEQGSDEDKIQGSDGVLFSSSNGIEEYNLMDRDERTTEVEPNKQLTSQVTRSRVKKKRLKYKCHKDNPLSPVTEEFGVVFIGEKNQIIDKEDDSFEKILHRHENIIVDKSHLSEELNLNEFTGVAPLASLEDKDVYASSLKIGTENNETFSINCHAKKEEISLNNEDGAWGIQSDKVMYPNHTPADSLITITKEDSVTEVSEILEGNIINHENTTELAVDGNEEKHTDKLELVTDSLLSKDFQAVHEKYDFLQDSENIIISNKCVRIENGNHILNEVPSEIQNESLFSLKCVGNEERLIDDILPVNVKENNTIEKCSKQLKHLNNGPLQTSSPKLGRSKSKDSPFKTYPQKLGKSEETLLDIMPLNTQKVRVVAKSQEELEDNIDENNIKGTLLRTVSLGPHHKKKRNKSVTKIKNVASKETVIDDYPVAGIADKGNLSPTKFVLDRNNLMIHNELMKLSNYASFYKPPDIIAYPLTSSSMPPLPDTTEVPSVSDTEGHHRVSASLNNPTRVIHMAARSNSNPSGHVDPPPKQGKSRHHSENPEETGDNAPKRRWTPKQKRDRRAVSEQIDNDRNAERPLVAVAEEIHVSKHDREVDKTGDNQKQRHTSREENKQETSQEKENFRMQNKINESEDRSSHGIKRDKRRQHSTDEHKGETHSKGNVETVHRGTVEKIEKEILEVLTKPHAEERGKLFVKQRESFDVSKNEEQGKLHKGKRLVEQKENQMKSDWVKDGQNIKKKSVTETNIDDEMNTQTMARRSEETEINQQSRKHRGKLSKETEIQLEQENKIIESNQQFGVESKFKNVRKSVNEEDDQLNIKIEHLRKSTDIDDLPSRKTGAEDINKRSYDRNRNNDGRDQNEEKDQDRRKGYDRSGRNDDENNYEENRQEDVNRRHKYDRSRRNGDEYNDTRPVDDSKKNSERSRRRDDRNSKSKRNDDEKYEDSRPEEDNDRRKISDRSRRYDDKFENRLDDDYDRRRSYDRSRRHNEVKYGDKKLEDDYDRRKNSDRSRRFNEDDDRRRSYDKPRRFDDGDTRQDDDHERRKRISGRSGRYVDEDKYEKKQDKDYDRRKSYDRSRRKDDTKEIVDDERQKDQSWSYNQDIKKDDSSFKSKEQGKIDENDNFREFRPDRKSSYDTKHTGDTTSKYENDKELRYHHDRGRKSDTLESGKSIRPPEKRERYRKENSKRELENETSDDNVKADDKLAIKTNFNFEVDNKKRDNIYGGEEIKIKPDKSHSASKSKSKGGSDEDLPPVPPRLQSLEMDDSFVNLPDSVKEKPKNSTINSFKSRKAIQTKTGELHEKNGEFEIPLEDKEKKSTTDRKYERRAEPRRKRSFLEDDDSETRSTRHVPLKKDFAAQPENKVTLPLGSPQELIVEKRDHKELEPYMYARGRRSGRIPKRLDISREETPDSESDNKKTDLDTLLPDNPIELNIDENLDNKDSGQFEETPTKKGIFNLFSCVGGKSSDILKKKPKEKKPIKKYYDEGEKRKIKKLTKEKERGEKNKLYFQDTEEVLIENIASSLPETEAEPLESLNNFTPELPEVPDPNLQISSRKYRRKQISLEVSKPLPTFMDPDAVFEDVLGTDDNFEEVDDLPLGTFTRWKEDKVEEPKLSSFMSAKREEKQLNKRNFRRHFEQNVGTVEKNISDFVDNDCSEEHKDNSNVTASSRSSSSFIKINSSNEEPIKLKGGCPDMQNLALYDDSLDSDLEIYETKPMLKEPKIISLDSKIQNCDQPIVDVKRKVSDNINTCIDDNIQQILIEQNAVKPPLVLNSVEIKLEPPTPESTLEDLFDQCESDYLQEETEHTEKSSALSAYNDLAHGDDHVLNLSAPSFFNVGIDEGEKLTLDVSHDLNNSFDPSASFEADMLYRRKHRTVSFDERLTSDRLLSPSLARKNSSLIAEPVTRPRSSSTTSNPLTYEPWRAKAYNKQHSHRSLSASGMLHGRSGTRLHKSHSIGEIYNSTVASSVARRRAKTLVFSDITSRMYQPRQRSRSRALLGDASFGSVAPIRQRSFSGFDYATSASSVEPTTATVKRSESERQPSKIQILEKEDSKNVERSKSDRRLKNKEIVDVKPASPSKSDTLRSTDSASGGETLEDRSSKEGSPTKEHPSPTKEKKKKKKFRIPSFSKKKSKENKESAI